MNSRYLLSAGVSVYNCDLPVVLGSWMRHGKRRRAVKINISNAKNLEIKYLLHVVLPEKSFFSFLVRYCGNVLNLSAEKYRVFFFRNVVVLSSKRWDFIFRNVVSLSAEKRSRINKDIRH